MDTELRRMGGRRVVEVAGGGGSGSGYAIGDDLVLTAGHVAVGLTEPAREPVRATVRLLDKTVHDAEVVWYSLHVDAAVVRVADAPWRDEPDRDALRWGKVVDDGVACVARGFPQSQGVDTETMRGRISASTAVRSERYDVNIAEPHLIPSRPGTSWWQGMSGAALFGLGRQLLGVVVADSPAHGGRRLEAVPVTRLMDEEGFRRVVGVRAGDVEDVWNRNLVELHVRDFLGPPYEPLPAGHADFHLLQAKHGVVPFIGRDDDLDRLRAWCAGPDLFSVAVVNGDGGAGKTRLGAQLCREFGDAGWAAGFARMSDLDRVIRAGTHVDVTWPTVLVLDYPDRASGEVFELIGRLSARRRGARLRIMLVDRAPSGPQAEFLTWRHRLNQDTLGEIERRTRVVVQLAAGGLGPGERRKHARRAWIAFGGGVEVSTLDLSDDGYRNPLKVHLAVLQALRGETHASSDGVVRGFFIRESARWEGRLPAHHIGDLTTKLARQAVALATLTTPTPDEAVELLTSFPQLADRTGVAVDRRTKVSEWLAELFPGGPVIAALAPDLLAEELLARTPNLGQLVLWVHDNDACTTTHMVTMLNTLRLAATQREDVRGVLTGLLARRLAPLVQAAVADPAGRLAGAVEAAIVLCADFDTSGEIAEAATKLAGPRPTTVDAIARMHCQVAELAAGRHSSPEAAAAAWTDLAAFRSVRGDHAGAVEAARRALDVFPRNGPPDALAHAIHNAGTALAVSGDLTAGHELLAEAVQRFRQLGREHLPALVDSLGNLTACLADQGNRAPAAEQLALMLEQHALLDRPDVMTEFVAPLRHLAGILPPGTPAPDPSHYRPPDGTHPQWSQRDRWLPRLLLTARLVVGFAEHAPRMITRSRLPLLPGRVAAEQERRIARDHAETLRWLGFVLRDVGRFADAIAPLDESVALLRQYDPDDHAWLAVRLDALGVCSAKAGRTEEAIGHARAAVAEHRAGDDPAALARSLGSLVSYLYAADLLSEAAEALRAAIELHRQTVDEPAMADAHAMLGVVLNRMSQTAAAVYHLTESAAIHRALAKSDPSHADGLRTTTALANRLSRPTDYVAEAREDVEHAATLAAANPALLPRHVAALDKLSSELGVEGQFAEALAEAERAVEMARLLPEGSADRAKALSSALSGVASWAQPLGEVDQALAAATEAVDLLAGLSGRDIPMLRAVALGTLSSSLIASNRPQKALDKAREVMDILDEEEESDETDWMRGLTLLDLGQSHLLLGRPSDAVGPLAVSRDLLTPAATDTPVARGLLARNLAVSGECLAQVGRPDEALAVLGELVALLPADDTIPGAGLIRASAFTAMANCHILLGRPTEGLHHATTALSYFHVHQPTDPNSRALHAAAHAAAGRGLGSMGRQTEAVDMHAEAARTYLDLVDSLPMLARGLTQTLTERAGYLIDLQRFPEAYQDAVNAIRWCPDEPITRDPLALAETCAALALLAGGDVNGALPHFTAARSHYDALGPLRRDEPYLLFLRGLTQCLLMLGKTAEAERAASNGLATVQILGVPVANVLVMLTQARLETGAPGAVQSAAEAVRVFREHEAEPGVPAMMASGLYILGLALRAAGAERDAVGPLQESATRFRTLAEPALLLEHHGTEQELATCLDLLGDQVGALEHARIALEIIAPAARTDPTLFPLLSEALLVYATSLVNAGRLADALSCLDEAAAGLLSLAQQDPQEHLSTLLAVFQIQAHCLRLLGRHQEATQVDTHAAYWGSNNVIQGPE
ncbi:tetratricopeptide repeat protein [Frankia sp. Cas3]|uniref:tetratricopeptide repeat protein n=1 Tax=Frankia sp. Cas3 TaxID=3073926 RepID=UPI002AD403C2|nr:tetratricopeptide repeat protein [Frankia sp. Cas3]